VKGGRWLTESELLQRTAAGFRVEEIYDAELKEDPAAVDGKVLPPDCGEGNRVDVVREETREFAEDLLDTNAATAVGVRP
jgi:hypothetical protein